MKRILLNVLIFSSFGFVSNAQWSGDPLVGTPVAVTSPGTTKLNNVAASDGANGMFVAWIDNRSATVPAIYIQRILPDGTLKFTSEVAASNAAGTTSSAKQNLVIVADGTGGAILVWQDSRNETATESDDDIYGQRVDANGNVLWGATGTRLTVSDNSISNKITPVIDVVNATEAIIVFGDNRSGTVDLYAQKVLLATGAAVWGSDIAVHGAATGTQNQQQIVNDGNGGAYIAWQDARVSGADLYAQHIDNSGAIVSGWGATGNAVSAQAQIQFQPQLVSLGTAGFVVTWNDQRAGVGNGDIYIQRYNAAGVEQWTPGGVALTSIAGNQSNPQITASGTNFIVAWSDARVGASDRNIYAQAVDANGTILWNTADGVPISTVAGSHQPNTVSGNSVAITILPDNAGGAIIVWDDARNATVDIYAQRINSTGMVQWTADGVPVSTATGNQLTPVAVNSFGSTVIVSWRDSRTLANGEIYAARLQSNGVLPIRSLTINAVVKNTSIDVKWTTIDESNTDFFIIEKSSDGARYSSIGSIKAKGTGNGAYLLNDVTPVKGANYYRIKTTDKNGASYYSSIALVQYDKEGKAVLVVYPNPVQQVATLQLANVAKGNYQLRVYDLSGRAVLQQRVTVAAEYQTIPISFIGLPANNYVIQLEANKRAVISKLVQKVK